MIVADLETAANIIKPLALLGYEFYNQYKKIPSNDKRCEHTCHIVEKLKPITEMEWKEVSPKMKSALKKLSDDVELAKRITHSYNNANVLTRHLKSSTYQEEFDSLYEMLVDDLIEFNEALCEELREMRSKIAEMEDEIV